ncbi:hypothetical protein [Dolosigranulum pigrum]|nr:hypothetical protein [Dolosigranulum pigrum]
MKQVGKKKLFYIRGGNLSSILCNINTAIKFNGQPLLKICPHSIKTLR